MRGAAALLQPITARRLVRNSGSLAVTRSKVHVAVLQQPQWGVVATSADNQYTNLCTQTSALWGTAAAKPAWQSSVVAVHRLSRCTCSHMSRLSSPKAAASTQAAKPAAKGGRGEAHEDAVRLCVKSAARATLAIPKQQEWVVDFIAESILADLLETPAQLEKDGSKNHQDADAGLPGPQACNEVQAAGNKPPGIIKVLRAAKSPGTGAAAAAMSTTSVRTAPVPINSPAGGAQHGSSSQAAVPRLPTAAAAAGAANAAEAGGEAAGARAPDGARVSRQLLARLPVDAEDASTQYASLLYDSLSDVDASDVTDFFASLCTSFDSLRGTLSDELGEGVSDASDDEEGTCEMCGRETALTKHHLIPRDVHKEMKKRGLSVEELQVGAMVCRLCHNAIHRNFTNKQLAMSYNSVEALMQVEALQRHVAWARKQKAVSAKDTQKLPAKFRNRR